jgi:hypothetical protein
LPIPLLIPLVDKGAAYLEGVVALEGGDVLNGEPVANRGGTESYGEREGGEARSKFKGGESS